MAVDTKSGSSPHPPAPPMTACFAPANYDSYHKMVIDMNKGTQYMNWSYNNLVLSKDKYLNPAIFLIFISDIQDIIICSSDLANQHFKLYHCSETFFKNVKQSRSIFQFGG